jgi:hypothetical protein
MKPNAETSTRNRLLVACLLLAMTLLFAPSAFVQQEGGNFKLHPTVVAGGGGTSTNGATQLSGTIGQNVAGVSAGGTFSLNAGFWQGEAPCALPQITAHPASQTACEGASVTLSVTVSDASVTYQWRKNGVDINGATSSTYTLNIVTTANAAAYDVVIAKPCGTSATSNPATLTVAAYMIAPNGASYPSSGGGGDINITVAGACSWSAVSNNAWITIRSNASGVGNGAVSYSVDANPGSGRTGTITAAGKTFTITQNAPTEITLISFAATAYDKGVLLAWQTGMESDNLGFNLYRDDGGKREAVNAQLVAGSALTTGASLRAGQSYAWWDASPASPSAAYWLEDVDLAGHSSWHGPFYARQAGGKPPASSQAALLGSISRTGDASVTHTVEPLAALPIAKGAIQSVNLAAQAAIKIGVRQTGYCRLSQAELLATGLSPAIDPRTLRLFVDGKELPILVTGESDGKFEASDTVEFYGLGLNTPATDTRTYWLVAGLQAGKRIAKAPEAKGIRINDSFAYTVERRDHSIYFPALKNGEAENFFGAVVTANPVDQALTTRSLAAEAKTEALLEIALQGVTVTAHRVMIHFNDSLVGYVDFNAQGRGVEKLTVPHSLLHEGDNHVRLQALNGSSDVSLVDFIRLTYQHAYRAEDGALRFTAQSGEAVTVAGFTSKQVRAFDVTDADNPQELTASIEATGKGYSLTVTPAGTGERKLVAFSDDKALRAAIIKANRPSRWGTTINLADMVIITHESLVESLKPLVAWREKQGLRIALIDTEDLYDEFSFGHKSSQAIKDFLAYASKSWQKKPRYALFAGDASYDTHNYLGFGELDLVPTGFIDTAYMETASDDWLADFDGDGLAELAVGRLPARTSREAALMVSKLIAYDQSSPGDAALLVADQNEGFNFEQASAALAPLLPTSLQTTQINRGQLGTEPARERLLEYIRHNQVVINYAGHGSINLWSGGLLTSADVDTLSNTNHLPLFVMMTCLNGYFHDPALDSLAESLVKAERGGAVAVFASSGMTLPEGQAQMNPELYRRLFDGRSTVGEAIRAAKAVTSDVDIRRTWHLFGDPTMRVK